MKYLRVLLVLALLASLAGLAFPAGAQEVPNTIVCVAGFSLLSGVPGEQIASGQGWTEDDLVDLYINGEYQGTAIAEPNAEGSASPFFDLDSMGIIAYSGDEFVLVRPSDGYSSSHVVTDLAMGIVDADADTVSGYAAPGSEVLVSPEDFETMEAFRYETADAAGMWVADFSIPGDEPDETGIFDIVSETVGFAMQIDYTGGGATFAFWAPTDTTEESGKLKVNAVFTDHPENLDETPWDIGALKINASEPDKGFLRMENPYKDWKYLRSLDPETLGLDPTTDVKKWFQDYLKEMWVEVDISCVNIIGNRAVVAGQVTATGDPLSFFNGAWIAAEFFDMDEYGLPDYYEDQRGDPPEGIYLTEGQVTAWCIAGDVPVPPDWFYYQRELLSGGIEISG